MRVTLLYFASLKQMTGVDSEQVTSDAADLRGLYQALQQRHGFPWSTAALRVAVDGEFAQWDDPVRDASEVAFIPPVSGG